MTRVAVVGDVYVPPGVHPHCDEDLGRLFSHCDAVLANVEGPITGSSEENFKTGPGLKQRTDVAEYLHRIGVTHACLANNHIMDFGISGVSDTVLACQKAGLVPLGVDLEDGFPGSVAYVDNGPRRICIINVCEREWVIDVDGHGASTFDTTSTNRVVRSESAAGNLPVVILHGGNEYYNLPSPWLRDQGRFLVESGAVAVLMHHSHVVAGWETYQGAPIAYGLGNFQFLTPSPRADWRVGIAAVLEFEETPYPRLELVPTIFDIGTGAVSIADPEESAAVHNHLAALASIVGSDASLAAHWERFVSDRREMYLRLAFPQGADGGRLVNAASAALMARRAFKRPNEAALLLNAVRCQSHRAALVSALEGIVAAHYNS